MVNCKIICNNPLKKHLVVVMMVLSFISNIHAQDSSDTDTMPNLPEPVRPSKVVVIVVLSVLLTLSVLLLLYIRFRRATSPELFESRHVPSFQALTRSLSRLSGIDREVIETLPFFRFSSLQGSKEGLECTVCLSHFEDTEILRLLPKCKHAFHMSCIDKWLENHSSCPLCRSKVDPLDIKNFTHSVSSRFLRVPSNLTEDTHVEIFVHREPSHRGSSSGYSIGSRFGNLGWSNKEEQLLIDQEVCGTSGKHVHRFNHKIVVSDVVTRSRWSDLNSSDMLSLKSEMLHDMASRRFSPFDESSLMIMNSDEKRSLSEIARVPRFIETCKMNRMEEGVALGGNNGREERLKRIWFPIAQRTVQWFAGQERNSRELEHKHLAPNA
ncbi:E3 ubiquitin-protein ligase ATL42 [Cajanus cajan]|uniref:RING-type E3 ubiquitin transferase n=1 Tax=Cajanus cajan TaxID=3821 RepID=A0A151QRA6_CAJCA|nr:E3 ubiquitin-protein ligase ATL42 [Cajanus cajan]KYP32840.1 Putative RING-H2 finger protein ATL2D [Cajanus cajan]